MAGYAIAIGTAGRLRLVVDPDADELTPSEHAFEQFQSALARSNAEGLVTLASLDWSMRLPATFTYWRGWVRRFFRILCESGSESGKSWANLPPPSDEVLAQFAETAPPMVGLEFISPASLANLWAELSEYVALASTSHRGGPLAWLQRVNPLAHLVGKVTFHLAENKRDEHRPFAFLATYAHKMTASAKPQHRPLADALKESIEHRDTEQLDRLLEPVRRAAEKSPLAGELLRSKQLFGPQAWTAAQAYRFLQETAAMEEAGVVVRIPNWWSVRRPPRPRVEVRIGEKAPSTLGYDTMLDFQPVIVVDGQPLTREEIKRLLADEPGLRLLKGKWVEVDQQRLKEALDHWKRMGDEHPDGIGIIEGMRLLAGAPIAGGDAEQELARRSTSDWTSLVAGDWFKSTLEKMRTPSEAAGCRPGRDLAATLRPYQAEGVRWLWFMTELGLGACLADDMGLGKTIQVLDLLLQRKRAAGKQVVSPSLLIAPASLLGNWRQEAARFAPTLRVCFAHNSEIDADELARRASNPAAGFADCDLVVTSYSMVRRQDWLETLKWSLIILDEAQAIKNAGSLQTRSIKKLHARQRIVMTGTPIENSIGELWSLFDFSSPGLLGSATEFKRYVKHLNQQGDGQAYAGLRKLVRPYILRRQKSDPNIAPDLPDKIEMRAECGLSQAQSLLYAKVVDDLKERLEKADGIQRKGLVLTALMQFKQICNHPAQFLGEGDFPVEKSGKFERLRQLCEPIIARQEKMLVFTQFQSLCEPLAQYLGDLFGQTGLVLHGGTPVKKRSTLVKEFQENPDRPFFVISLKAGGSGLNLTAASHVVHFDRWWNPAVENQATDRAFRIGQKRNVLVHKFVCLGTIEERIDTMITDKKAVADQILDGDGAPKLSEMTNDEVMKFVALDFRRATRETATADESGSPGNKRGKKAEN